MENWMDGLQSAFDAAINDADSGSSGEKRSVPRLPEGEYEATIIDSTFSKEDRKITFKLHFHGFGKDGTTRYKSSKLTPNSIKFVMSDLKRAGQAIKSLSELPEAVANLKGAVVKVSVKNRKDSDIYQNFYFESFLRRDRAVTEFHEVFGNKPSTDDIPF